MATPSAAASNSVRNRDRVARPAPSSTTNPGARDFSTSRICATAASVASRTRTTRRPPVIGREAASSGSRAISSRVSSTTRKGSSRAPATARTRAAPRSRIIPASSPYSRTARQAPGSRRNASTRAGSSFIRLHPRAVGWACSQVARRSVIRLAISSAMRRCTCSLFRSIAKYCGVEDVEAVDHALRSLGQPRGLGVAGRQGPVRVADQPDAGWLGEVQHALRLTRDPEVDLEVGAARRRPIRS